MSIRERTWTTSKGVKKSNWIVDYFDQGGKRHQKTFTLKRDAKTFESQTHVEVMDRIHVADADTITIAEAGALWLEDCRSGDLEPTTIKQYSEHVRLHIDPFIGSRKLTEVTVPFVRAFFDRLRKEGRSAAMLRNVRVSLGSILSDAQERGLVVRNAVKEMSRARKGRAKAAKRHKSQVQVGVDVPALAEVRAIIAAVEGWRRCFIMTAALTGLRSSELRGLRWSDVDLAKGEITVRQRADVYRTIGSPKSQAGRRTVPIGDSLKAALLEWKPKCPKGSADLVFPNGEGKPEFHANLIQRVYQPAQVAAGVVAKADKADQEPKAKYTGLHALRHFYASLCINRRVDGGLEMPAKQVQTRLGHSSIQVTLDTYGHLFPRGDDSTEIAAAEKALLG